MLQHKKYVELDLCPSFYIDLLVVCVFERIQEISLYKWLRNNIPTAVIGRMEIV